MTEYASPWATGHARGEYTKTERSSTSGSREQPCTAITAANPIAINLRIEPSTPRPLASLASVQCTSFFVINFACLYPQVFGKYVLERELSRGGMARVILATLRGAGGFEKRLVVKQIRDELAFDQQFIRRFVEEAKTTVALSHPNIVPVYELGVEQ